MNKINKILLNMSMISAVAGVSSCRATTDTDLPSTLQNAATAIKVGEHITEASQNELWLSDESDVNEATVQDLENGLSSLNEEELPVPYNSFGCDLVIDLGTHLSQLKDKKRGLFVFMQAIEKGCFTTVSTIKLNDLKFDTPDEVPLFNNLLEALGRHLNLNTLEMKDVPPQLVSTMARILPSFRRLILLDLSNSNIPAELLNELINSVILDIPDKFFGLSLSGRKDFIDMLYEHVKTLDSGADVTRLINLDKYCERQDKLFSQYNDPVEKGEEMRKYFASLDKNSHEYLSLVSAYEISAGSKEICIKLICD